MKVNWNDFIGKTLSITMHENYGIVMDPNSNSPIYEIVFKSGTLINAFEDGLMLETMRENEQVKIFVPLQSIKCVEIF
jgi:hypothetical protein